MNAAGAVARYGKRLVGKYVITPAMGAYPGGLAKVIEVGHDPDAPEIAFLVEHVTWKDEDGSATMGIFENEAVQIAIKQDYAQVKVNYGKFQK